MSQHRIDVGYEIDGSLWLLAEYCVYWIDSPESFFGDVLRIESRCVWHECAEFWHKQNVSTFRTSFWRAVDGGSGPISVLGDAKRSYRSPSEYSLTRARPPLFGELSCLKADHPYRGRESCHLKYINSLISRVVIVGFGLHGRTYMCYQRRDHRVVSTVDGPEAPEFRANTRRDQFPRVSIFLFLSTCHLHYFIFK